MGQCGSDTLSPTCTHVIINVLTCFTEGAIIASTASSQTSPISMMTLGLILTVSTRVITIVTVRSNVTF